MRNLKKLIGPVLALSILFISGCALKNMVKMAKDQELKVDPSPLELHGDSVKFEMSAILPVKMLKKNKIYTVDVTYETNDNVVEVGSIEFKKEDYPDADEEEPRASKNFAFAYKPPLKSGELKVKGTASNQNGKSKSTPKMTVAKGIITTSQLVKNVTPVTMAPHGYNNKPEYKTTTVNFYFPKNVHKLQPDEKQSDRAEFFRNFIANKFVTKTVNIVGTHSPEGPELINEELSEKRAMEIKEYYKKMMSRYNYSDSLVDSIKFVLKDIVKDWTDFKSMVKSDNNLSQEQKDKILKIVNNPKKGDSFRKTELRLHDLKSYDYLTDSIYPDLRVARTEVITKIPKKSDAEISMLAGKIYKGNVNADTLSKEELLYAATLTPLLDEKQKIYKAATKKLDSWKAHNNLAAIYLKKARRTSSDSKRSDFIEMASTQMELAKKKKENGIVLSNMSTIHLLKEEEEAALETAEKGLEVSSSANAKKDLNSIKGVLLTKQGKYDEALDAYSNAGSDSLTLYNKGLAQLLNYDFNKAKSTLNSAVQGDKDNALGYYCLGVTGARLDNKSMVMENLPKAFKYDDDLKERATNDLEFRNYWDSPEFKETLD